MVDLVVSIFINVGVVIILGALNKVGSLGGSLLALAYFVEMSNFMAVFALGILGILGRTPFPWLVFMFSTSHALALHPLGFSGMMSRIRRSLLSRFILCLVLSIFSVLFVASALVLSMVICNRNKCWNPNGSDSCDEHCNLLTVALENPL